MGIFYNPPQPPVGSHSAASPGWSVDNPPVLSGVKDVRLLTDILTSWIPLPPQPRQLPPSLVWVELVSLTLWKSFVLDEQCIVNFEL